MTILPIEIEGAFVEGLKLPISKYFRFIPNCKRERYLKILQGHAAWQEGVPFAVGAFGEIMARTDDGYIILYNLAFNKIEILMKGERHFAEVMNDESIQEEYFDVKLFAKAEKEKGALKDSQCYVFEPIPAVGGSGDIDSIAIGDTLTYLAMMVQMVWQ